MLYTLFGIQLSIYQEYHLHKKKKFGSPEATLPHQQVHVPGSNHPGEFLESRKSNLRSEQIRIGY